MSGIEVEYSLIHHHKGSPIYYHHQQITMEVLNAINPYESIDSKTGALVSDHHHTCSRRG